MWKLWVQTESLAFRDSAHQFRIPGQAAHQAPDALVAELESEPKLKTASGG